MHARRGASEADRGDLGLLRRGKMPAARAGDGRAAGRAGARRGGGGARRSSRRARETSRRRATTSEARPRGSRGPRRRRAARRRRRRTWSTPSASVMRDASERAGPEHGDVHGEREVEARVPLEGLAQRSFSPSAGGAEPTRRRASAHGALGVFAPRSEAHAREHCRARQLHRRRQGDGAARCRRAPDRTRSLASSAARASSSRGATMREVDADLRSLGPSSQRRRDGAARPVANNALRTSCASVSAASTALRAAKRNFGF